MTTPKAVLRAYYAISGLYALAASLIWGVNTLFLLDAGLSVLGVFVANAVFTASMAVFEVPTGIVADAQGRRASFLLSIAVLCVGTLAYVACAQLELGLWGFCAASVVLGLGYTFYSGAVDAWLVDALNATGFQGGTDAVFARGSLVWGGAMLVGTIGGGLLGNIDLSLPYVVRSALLVGVFALAFVGMRDIGFTPERVPLARMPAAMVALAQRSVQHGWSKPSVRMLVVIGAVQSVTNAWSYHAWQPYFLELLDSNAVWVAGVIAAGTSLAAMGGNAFVDYGTRWCGRRTTLIALGIGLEALAMIAVGLAPSFGLAVTAYLVAMWASGVHGPVRRAYLHARTESGQRATVASFDSLAGSVTSCGGQAGLGALAQRAGFAPGYVLGGLIGLAGLPIIAALRRRREFEDRILGSAAEHRSCPVGLPAATGTD